MSHVRVLLTFSDICTPEDRDAVETDKVDRLTDVLEGEFPDLTFIEGVSAEYEEGGTNGANRFSS